MKTSSECTQTITSVQLTLDLSIAEARALAQVCNNIGGHQKDSMRYVFDVIRAELRGAGISCYKPDGETRLGHDTYYPTRGTIYFEDTDNNPF